LPSSAPQMVKIYLIALEDNGQSGLYNALYQSDLHLGGVNIKDGVAIIDLSGSLQVGGECDSPRVEAQIQQMALQFTTVKDVSVRLNGRTLQDVLSLK
jgi:spore germination protein GerM